KLLAGLALSGVGTAVASPPHFHPFGSTPDGVETVGASGGGSCWQVWRLAASGLLWRRHPIFILLVQRLTALRRSERAVAEAVGGFGA
ncbi:MAG: hypothetical protein ACI8QS_001563, partial [Planctomycetota bacterium]